MATDHLQVPDIAAAQNQKEVTANAAHNLLDRKVIQRTAKAITGDASFTDAEARENTLIELTGTPGAPHIIDMNDTNENRLAVLNNTDDVMTINNFAGAGGSNDVPVIQIGEIVEFQYDGTDFDILSRRFSSIGYLDLSLGGLRETLTNETAGPLDNTTAPTYSRLNGATDKALVVTWATSIVDEVHFPTVAMPPDMDAGSDLIVHLVARMDGTAGPDNPTIDVQVYDGIGDTEMGSATAAVTSTLAELTVTITAANLTGHPLGFLSISLVPGSHANDAIELFSAWIEYTKKFA